MKNFNISPEAHADIFISLSTKALTQNFNSLPWGINLFLCQLGCLWCPLRVSGHAVGLNLRFNSPHKVHSYNLLMWYTMDIQAIKHS